STGGFEMRGQLLNFAAILLLTWSTAACEGTLTPGELDGAGRPDGGTVSLDFSAPGGGGEDASSSDDLSMIFDDLALVSPALAEPAPDMTSLSVADLASPLDFASSPADLAYVPHLTLDWMDNSTDEDGFGIERKVTMAGTYALLTTVGPNVT